MSLKKATVSVSQALDRDCRSAPTCRHTSAGDLANAPVCISVQACGISTELGLGERSLA